MMRQTHLTCHRSPALAAWTPRIAASARLARDKVCASVMHLPLCRGTRSLVCRLTYKSSVCSLFVIAMQRVPAAIARVPGCSGRAAPVVSTLRHPPNRPTAVSRQPTRRSAQVDPVETEIGDVQCVGVGMEVVCEVKPHVPTPDERNAATATAQEKRQQQQQQQQQPITSTSKSSEDQGAQGALRCLLALDGAANCSACCLFCAVAASATPHPPHPP